MISTPVEAPRIESHSESVSPRVWAKRIEYVIPIAVLLVGAMFVFRYSLFLGYRFIGNSDRWNHYLSFAAFHSHNLTQGVFAAWSEYVFTGFDTLALPFSFFSPLFALPALLGTTDVVSVFGYIAFGLFAITLVSAYWVLIRLTHAPLASLAGGCTYACTTYALLKLSQNDQTYLSIATAPAYFYLVHTTDRTNWVRRLVVLSLLSIVELYFAFLQEFSYTVLFLLFYGTWILFARSAASNPATRVEGSHDRPIWLWRHLVGRVRSNWPPLTAFIGSLALATVVALPRVLVQFQTVSTSSRAESSGLNDLVDWRLFPRFFSRDILGRSYAESLQAPTPAHVNLYEGDLLFSSVFASLLTVLVIVSLGYRFRSFIGNRERIYNIAPLVVYILFVLAVMHVPAVYLALVWLYHGVSFLHSRVNVSAMFPVALVTSFYLARKDRSIWNVCDLMAIAVGSAIVFAASAFDYAIVSDRVLALLRLRPHQFLDCQACIDGLVIGPFLTVDLIRTGVLTALFLGLVFLSTWFGAHARAVALSILGVSITFQAIWGASNYVAGPQTRSYTNPYEAHDFVLAPANQFIAPDQQAIDNLQALLDNADYRSITICPQRVTLVDCSDPMGMLWHVRLVDGYLSGIQDRFASLPWGQGDYGGSWNIGFRNLRFEAPERLPWRVLSFLNVRQAIVITASLYENSGVTIPDDIQLIQNPSSYVYPRAYFAAVVRSVSRADDAIAVANYLGFADDTTSARPTNLEAPSVVDFVEGPVLGEFDTSGDLSWDGSGDRLAFSFPPSSKKRVLIVNESYADGWTASVDGTRVPVYPANVVMRGIVVPEGAQSVVLEYHSFLWWAWWYTLVVLAVIAGGGLLLWRRLRATR